MLNIFGTFFKEQSLSEKKFTFCLFQDARMMVMEDRGKGDLLHRTLTSITMKIKKTSITMKVKLTSIKMKIKIGITMKAKLTNIITKVKQ